MSKYEFKDWFKAAGIRAIKTIAQTALGFITVGLTMAEIDWKAVVSVAVVAGVYSLLTSIAGLPELDLSPAYCNEVEEQEGGSNEY